MKSCVAMVALLACAVASTASAQDDDWDFSAGNRLTAASVEFQSGARVVVQCHEDVLTVAIAGTPLSFERLVASILERDGEAPVNLTWATTSDGRMATTGSRRIARLLYRGGPITVRSAASGEQAFRVVFDLPALGASLGRVLADCRTQLVDDRDPLASAEPFLEEIPIVWRPTRRLPGRADSQTVEISCIVRQARLRDCRPDMTIPENPAAGSAVAQAADGVAVELSDPVAAEGGVVDIEITESNGGRTH